MNLKSILSICSLAFIAYSTASCSGNEPDKPSSGNEQGQAITLSIVDKQATPETKALYSNLWTIGQKGFMFGHHDDLMYGRNGMTNKAGLTQKMSVAITPVYIVLILPS